MPPNTQPKGLEPARFASWVKRGVLALAAIVVITSMSSKPAADIGDAPVAATATTTASETPKPVAKQSAAPAITDPKACEIAGLELSPATGFKAYSPDGKRFVLNKEDAAGIGQIYIGNAGSDKVTCLTCVQRPGGPGPDRYKTQAGWHPSGRWIIFAAERDSYSKPPILGDNRDYIEGQIRNGLYVNVWAITPDGENWHRLTDLRDGPWGVPMPSGITGPVISPDGKKAYWSQIVDGNIFAYYPFGRWELMLADFVVENGIPKLANAKNITPPGMHWNEPGNFAPDGSWFIFSGSTEKDAQGMDQYRYDIPTGKLTNLTNTPTIWDEHGRLSPDGKKIIWMSAYPYRSDPGSSKILSIRTDFMLMDADGTNYRQLTHFKETGYPESSDGIAASMEWDADGRTAQLRQLFFPNYRDWTIEFKGPCGKQ